MDWGYIITFARSSACYLELLTKHCLTNIFWKCKPSLHTAHNDIQDHRATTRASAVLLNLDSVERRNDNTFQKMEQTGTLMMVESKLKAEHIVRVKAKWKHWSLPILLVRQSRWSPRNFRPCSWVPGRNPAMRLWERSRWSLLHQL